MRISKQKWRSGEDAVDCDDYDANDDDYDDSKSTVSDGDLDTYLPAFPLRHTTMMRMMMSMVLITDVII